MGAEARCLAVIPARGGSKGIPGKNMRLLRGRPLIGHILETAIACEAIDEIVVSSDDLDILRYAGLVWGVRIHERSASLSGDDVTLDPVIHEAVETLEMELNERFETIVTLQPTSPTLTSTSLQKALIQFASSRATTFISVAQDAHLRWKLIDGKPSAVQENRLNRQFLPQEFRETGAFIITQRDCVTPASRFGQRIELYTLPRGEDVDVDDSFDWMIAETMMQRLRIAFIVRGSVGVGMGHAYRGLTIADSMLGNDLMFCAYQSDPVVWELIRNRGYEVSDASSEKALLDWVHQVNPNIVVCDILDTNQDIIRNLQASGAFVVTFEDLGSGSYQANLVFNALYELTSPPDNHRFGANYVCLPASFHAIPPVPFRRDAQMVLVTFGGTDTCNLTVLACGAMTRLVEEGYLESVIVVLGPGYAHDAEFQDFLSILPPHIRGRIEVHRSVQNMAALISKADVAITSNGRTVYELAAMGVPSLCMAQNDRETSHLFARYSEGFEYLGMGLAVTEDRVYEAMRRILSDNEMRRRMREALQNVDLREGMRRVRTEILGEYWRWKDGGSTHRGP